MKPLFFLFLTLASVMCRLKNEDGTVFRDPRPLYSVPYGEKYGIEVPARSKFTIDLPTIQYEPAYWQLENMENLCHVKCKVRTEPVIMYLKESPANKILFPAARRIFTCIALKPGKVELKFSYSRPYVKMKAFDYTVKVHVKKCRGRRFY